VEMKRILFKKLFLLKGEKVSTKKQKITIFLIINKNKKNIQTVLTDTKKKKRK
jgi:hypothetical protein